MKEFKSVVQDLLNNHERHRRYVALLTVLCMIMSFTVSLILIEPAESQTGELICGYADAHTHSVETGCYAPAIGENGEEYLVLTCEKEEHVHSQECYAALEESDEHNGVTLMDSSNVMQLANDGYEPKLDEYGAFDGPASGPPSRGHKITADEINNIDSVVINGESQEGELKDGKLHFSYEAGNGEDSVEISFNLNFSIGEGIVDKDTPYIYYQLPDGIEPIGDFSGPNCMVYDENDVLAGYFSINSDGLIVIHFRDYYLDNVLKGGAFEGFIRFDGYINRAENSDGDQHIEGGKTVFDITFDDKNFDIEKKAHDVWEDQTKVRWEIIAENFYDDTSWIGCKITDDNFKNAVGGYDAIKVDPSDAGHFDSNGDFILDKDEKKVTFTYYTELSEAQDKNGKNILSEDNTAHLTGQATNKEDDSKFTVNESDGAHYETDAEGDIEKTGSMNADGTIEWTITVDRPYDKSLKGYQVQDNVFKSLKKEDITVVPNVGFSLNGDTLTFDSDITASSVTITYTTAANDSNLRPGSEDLTESNTVIGKKVKNTAHLINNHGTGVDDDTGEVEIIDESKNTKVEKNGQYDQNSGDITWTVKGQYIRKSTDTILDGYEIYDEALKGKSISDLFDVYTQNSFNAWLIADYEQQPGKIVIRDGNHPEEIYAVISLSDGTLKVEAGDNGKGISYIEFKYKTKASDATEDGSINGTTKGTPNDKGEYNVYNRAEDGYGHVGTGSAWVNERFEIHKYLIGDDSGFSYGYADGNPTLSWKITATSDKGFEGNDKILVDDLNPATGAHYINNLSDIHVYGKVDGQDRELAPGDGYYKITPKTVTVTVDGTAVERIIGFTIEFTDKVDDLNIHEVWLEYESVADITNIPEGKWGYFSNQASFGTENSEKPQYSHEVRDSKADDREDLTVTKRWEELTSVDHDPIKFRLQRSTDNINWETVYWNETDRDADGNPIWQTVTVPANDTTSYTYTLSDENEWTKIMSGIPVDDDQHNAYYYRAVEVNVPEGYSDNNSDEYIYFGDVSHSTTFTIVNTSDEGFKKNIVSVGGVSVQNGDTVGLDKMQPITFSETFGGVTSETDYYYIFGYEITIGDPSAKDYTDTFPEGFSLVFTQNWDEIYQTYNPYFYNYTPGGQNKNVDYGSGEYSVEFDDKHMIFHKGEGIGKFRYYLKVPASVLEAKYANQSAGITFTNNMSDGNYTDSAGITITKTTATTSPEEGGLLTKEANVESGYEGDSVRVGNGVISFSIYVNPEGKKLSNSNEYDITDVLTFGASTLMVPTFDDDGNYILDSREQIVYEEITVSAEEILKKLEAGQLTISVEEILSDGKTKSLDADKYRYTIDYMPSTMGKTYPAVRVDGSIVRLEPYELKPGDDYSIEIIPDAGFDCSNLWLAYDANYSKTAGPLPYTVDEDGRIWLTIPNDGEIPLYLDDYSHQGDKWSARIIVHNRENVEAAARLTVTVPDAKPLKITYSYTLTSNGESLGTGSIVTAHNTASLDTGNVSSSATSDDDSFFINQATAGVRTQRQPQIIKHNIGNLGNLLDDAQFYLARFDSETNQWIYADSVTARVDKISSSYVLNHYPSFGGSSLEDAATIEIPDKSGNYLLGQDVSADSFKPEDLLTTGTYNVELEEGYLYKIIEIKTPSGYEGDQNTIDAINRQYYPNSDPPYKNLKELVTAYLKNEVSDNSPYFNLISKFVAVHYFKYGKGTVSTPEDENIGKVATVTSGNALEIPNNELINVTATKSWGDTKVTSEDYVEVTLYYSYVKSSNGFPSELHEATAEDLGLTELQATKRIYAALSEGQQGTISPAIWSDIPNGINDRAIFYYVKETAYHINGNTYALQTDGTYKKVIGTDSDGKYIVDENDSGTFQPTYTGNGTVKDGTVKIVNATGLSVTKMWTYSDNEEMSEGDIPVESISFILFGTDANGDEHEIYHGTLTKSDIPSKNWTMTIPENLEGKGDHLSDYTSFRIMEIKEGDTLYGYVDSYGYNVIGSIGEITITNKNKTLTKVDVSVEKSWSDGETEHESDEILVYLFRAGSFLSADAIEILSEYHENKILPNGVEFVELAPVDGVSQNPVILSSGHWKKEWKNLPYSGNNVDSYKYFAIEQKSSIPEGYKAKYTRDESDSTKQILYITNSVPGLSVNKRWVDSNGNTITSGFPTDKVRFELYRRAIPSSTPQFDPDDLPDEQIKIMALGDSITHSYIDGGANDGYRKYMYDVLTKASLRVDMVGKENDWVASKTYQKDEYTTITYDPQHEGHSGYFIKDISTTAGVTGSGIYEYIQNNSTIDSYDPDIVLLLVGTNDVMKDNAYGSEINTVSQEEYKERYLDLLTEIYNQKTDVEVFIMSPPPICSAKGQDQGYPVTDQSAINANLKKCIDAIESIISDYSDEANYPQYKKRTLKYIDINKLFNDTDDYTGYLSDYCHPNEYGYELMGNYIANVLLTYLATGSADVPTGGTTGSAGSGSDIADFQTNINGYPGVPDDFYLEDGKTVNEELYQRVKETEIPDGEFTLPLPDGSWTKVFKNLPEKNSNNERYVYYVVEEETGTAWEISYTGNGQTIADEGSSIKITNMLQTISLKVKKRWNDDGAVNRGAITFNVFRTTKPEKIKNQTKTPDALTATPDSIGMVINDTRNITFNKDVDGLKISIEPDDPNPGIDWKPDPYDPNGIIITSTGNVGTATVVISDGFTTVRIPVTVTERPTLVVTSSHELTLEVDQTSQITVGMSDGSTPDTVNYRSENAEIASVSNGVIKAENWGTTTIYVTDGTTEIPIKVTVVYPKFDFSPKNVTVTLNGTASLNLAPIYGEITYEYDNTKFRYDPKTGTVTGLEVGVHTIKAKRAVDNAEATATINVIAQPVLELESESSLTLEIGQTSQIQVKLSNGATPTNVQYRSEDNAIASVNNGTITAMGWGTTTINVTDGTTTIPITVKVVYPEFSFNKQSVEITDGGTADLTLSSRYGEITYTFAPNDYGLTYNAETGKITMAEKKGIESDVTVTLTAYRSTEKECTATAQITIKPAGNDNTIKPSIPLDNSREIESVEFVFDFSETAGYFRNYYQFDGWQTAFYVWCNTWTNQSGYDSMYSMYDNIDEISVDGNKVCITFKEGFYASELLISGADGSPIIPGTYKVNYAGASGAALISNKLSAKSVSILANEGEEVEEEEKEPGWYEYADGIEIYYPPITLTGNGDNWEATLNNLPVYSDGEGEDNIYYYWVEEENVPYGYTDSYRFTDDDDDPEHDGAINAASPGAGLIEVTNTKRDSSGTTMPSTGGKGTMPYTAAGVTIITTSGAILFMKRRKRKQTRDGPH